MAVIIFLDFMPRQGYNFFTKTFYIRLYYWLGLVKMYLHAKNYQNIPSGLKIIATGKN